MAAPTLEPTTSLKAVPLSLASTFGALFLGYTFATMWVVGLIVSAGRAELIPDRFYGITCCQIVAYYRSRRSHRDSRMVKYMVRLVLFHTKDRA